MTEHLTSSGARHPGDEFDCSACRAGLLEAFREPGSVPLPGTSPVPHTVLGPEHSRTVDLGHAVTSRVVPHTDRPGGTWSAVCTCGWTKSGAYVRNGMGETTAARLARVWADQHRMNPLEGDEDR